MQNKKDYEYFYSLKRNFVAVLDLFKFLLVVRDPAAPLLGFSLLVYYFQAFCIQGR